MGTFLISQGFLFSHIVKTPKTRRFSNKILILFSFPIAEISKGSRFKKVNKDNVNCPFEDSQLFQKHREISPIHFGEAR